MGLGGGVLRLRDRRGPSRRTGRCAHVPRARIESRLLEAGEAVSAGRGLGLSASERDKGTTLGWLEWRIAAAAPALEEEVIDEREDQEASTSISHSTLLVLLMICIGFMCTPGANIQKMYAKIRAISQSIALPGCWYLKLYFVIGEVRGHAHTHRDTHCTHARETTRREWRDRPSDIGHRKGPAYTTHERFTTLPHTSKQYGPTYG